MSYQKLLWLMSWSVTFVFLLVGCGEQAVPSSDSPIMPSLTPTLQSALSPPTHTPTLPMPLLTPTLSADMFFQEMSKNWRVVYADYQANAICVMYGDGSGKFCIPFTISNIYSVEEFSWSPDGRRLVFSDTFDLYIWNLDGGITPFVEASDIVFRTPDWSPDGNSIAYASSEVGGKGGPGLALDVFVRSLDGNTKINLSHSLGDQANSRNPDWSPDGNKIVFDSRVMRRFNFGIFIVSSDGSGLATGLTNNEADDVHPIWSPDGRQIAYLSNQEHQGGTLAFDLFVMNADGSGAHLLSDLAIPFDEHIEEYDFPYYWLPDGKSILVRDQLINVETGIASQIQFPFDAEKVVWHIPAQSATIVPLPTPNCASDWSHLFVGAWTIVAGGTNDSPNRVRAGPSKLDETITNIYPGTIVKVIEGPVCTDGLVFWKVENNSIPGGSGWTAEGDGTEYWLEPYQP